MAETTCPECGRIEDGGANFCPSCGHEIRATSDETTDTFELGEELPHEEDRARFPHDCGLFVVESGPKAGARYGLEAELTTLGRHGDADIFFDDVTVSRRHAEVERTDDRYLVRDSGSLHGTYVNRERIESALLQDGDELQIGRFRLVFFHGTAD